MVLDGMRRSSFDSSSNSAMSTAIMPIQLHSQDYDRSLATHLPLFIILPSHPACLPRSLNNCKCRDVLRMLESSSRSHLGVTLHRPKSLIRFFNRCFQSAIFFVLTTILGKKLSRTFYISASPTRISSLSGTVITLKVCKSRW